MKKFFLLFLPFIFTISSISAQGSGSTLDFNTSNEGVNLGDSVGNNIRTIKLWFLFNINIDNTNVNPQSLIVRDYNFAALGSTNEFGLYFGSTAFGAAGGILHFKRHIGTTKHEIVSNQSSWDGTYNGANFPETTYYYVIDLGEGSDYYKGPLLIISEE